MVNTVQVTIKIDKAANVVVNIIEGQQMSVANIGPPSVGAGPWSYTEANVAYMKLVKTRRGYVDHGRRQHDHHRRKTIDFRPRLIRGKWQSRHRAQLLDGSEGDGRPGQYIIPTTVRARIHISKGFYHSANPTYVWHPNGQSITITGPPTSWQWSNAVGISGSSWNWKMTLYNLANTSQFTAGDWAIVWGAGNVTTANHCLCCGYFAVEAVGPNWVRVQVPNYRTSFPVAGLTSLYIMPIQVNIACTTKNQSAFVIGPDGLLELKFCGFACAVVPDVNTNGVVAVVTPTRRCRRVKLECVVEPTSAKRGLRPHRWRVQRQLQLLRRQQLPNGVHHWRRQYDAERMRFVL